MKKECVSAERSPQSVVPVNEKKAFVVVQLTSTARLVSRQALSGRKPLRVTAI